MGQIFVAFSEYLNFNVCYFEMFPCLESWENIGQKMRLKKGYDPIVTSQPYSLLFLFI